MSPCWALARVHPRLREHDRTKADEGAIRAGWSGDALALQVRWCVLITLLYLSRDPAKQGFLREPGLTKQEIVPSLTMH